MKKINVYCGETIENQTSVEYHPVTLFNRAKECMRIAMLGNFGDTPMSLFSNSPDFVSTIFYLGNHNNMQIEFFLNDVSCGNNIEPIFDDFNRFYDLLDEHIKQ